MPFCNELIRSHGSCLNMAAIGPRTAHVLSRHVLQGPENGRADDHRPRSSVLASCRTVSYWLSNSCQPNVLLLLWVQFDEFGFLFFPPTITFPSRLQVCLTSDLPSVFPHPSLRSQNIVLSSQSFYLLIISIYLRAHRTLSFRGPSAGEVLFSSRVVDHMLGGSPSH